MAERTAKARTEPFRAELAHRAGGMLDQAEAAELLGVSPGVIGGMLDRRELLGVPYATKIRFPAVQFRSDLVGSTLTPILEAFGDMNPWGQLQLLLAPLDGFGDAPASIFDMLANGVDDDTRERLVWLIRGGRPDDQQERRELSVDAEPEDPRPLPWPLVTIDFEASSLDSGTYPIEVGVCRWTSPNRPIEGWSTLIRPLPEWDAYGSWWRASEEVHGIKRAELDAGMTPTEAITALNAILGDRPAFCDGGGHDFHWARMLARGSGVRPGRYAGLAQLSDPAVLTRLAHVVRTDADHLVAQAGRRLVEPGDRRLQHFIDFAGLVLPRSHLELRRRRVSPLALLDADHHRQAWLIAVLPFCPETLERLVDTCPLCGSALGWCRPPASRGASTV